MNRTNVQHEIKPTPTEVSKVLTAKMQIGEGPVWDAKQQRLLWVDIVGQELNVFDPTDGSILALTGNIRRLPNQEHYASYAGTAPIDVSSGDLQTVVELHVKKLVGRPSGWLGCIRGGLAAAAEVSVYSVSSTK